MGLSDQYEPSPAQWVRDQVEFYERSGGTEANTLRDTGLRTTLPSASAQRVRPRM